MSTVPAIRIIVRKIYLRSETTVVSVTIWALAPGNGYAVEASSRFASTLRYAPTLQAARYVARRLAVA